MVELIVLVICLYALAAVLVGLVIMGVYLKIEALLALTVVTLSALCFWYWRAPERSRWCADSEDLQFVFTLVGLALVIVWTAAGFTHWAWPSELFHAAAQWAIR